MTVNIVTLLEHQSGTKYQNLPHQKTTLFSIVLSTKAESLSHSEVLTQIEQTSCF